MKEITTDFQKSEKFISTVYEDLVQIKHEVITIPEEDKVNHVVWVVRETHDNAVKGIQKFECDSYINAKTLYESLVNRHRSFLGANTDGWKLEKVLHDEKFDGSHSIHLVEGGSYLTECTVNWDNASDVGWFEISDEDYQRFKKESEWVCLR